MVRLNLFMDIRDKAKIIYFNSTMVRLNHVFHAVLLIDLTKFQFHYG